MTPTPLPLSAYRERLRALLASPTPQKEAEELFGLVGPTASKVLTTKSFLASREEPPGGVSR